MQAKELRRDKTIGLTLIIIGIIVLPIYLLLIFYPAEFLHFFGVPVDGSTGIQVRVYAALIPVAIGVVFMLLAGAWIGVSIMTTPELRENQEIAKSNSQKRFIATYRLALLFASKNVECLMRLPSYTDYTKGTSVDS
jgi:hypothetical protein